MGDNKWLRNSFVYVIIMVAVLVLLFAVLNPQKQDPPVSITQLAKDIELGQVDTIKLQDDSNQVLVTYKDKHTAATTKESQSTFPQIMASLGVTPDQLNAVKITVEPASSWGNWLGTLGFILPT